MGICSLNPKRKTKKISTTTITTISVFCDHIPPVFFFLLYNLMFFFLSISTLFLVNIFFLYGFIFTFFVIIDTVIVPLFEKKKKKRFSNPLVKFRHCTCFILYLTQTILFLFFLFFVLRTKI